MKEKISERKIKQKGEIGFQGKNSSAWAAGTAFLALFMLSCPPGFSPNDPVLTKPLDQLTDQDLSRMVANVSTNYGSFRIQLHPEWAPQTCRNFIKLVRAGFYDGLTFHEVMPGIWIRGGDPKGDGTGGPGWNVKMEKPIGKLSRGAGGLYHPNFAPDEGGSQFFILLKDCPHLNGVFTVFGQVIEGMATVERIGNMPVTPGAGKPRPYMPLSAVIIKDIHLEAKK